MEAWLNGHRGDTDRPHGGKYGVGDQGCPGRRSQRDDPDMFTSAGLSRVRLAGAQRVTLFRSVRQLCHGRHRPGAAISDERCPAAGAMDGRLKEPTRGEKERKQSHVIASRHDAAVRRTRTFAAGSGPEATRRRPNSQSTRAVPRHRIPPGEYSPHAEYSLIRQKLAAKNANNANRERPPGGGAIRPRTGEWRHSSGDLGSSPMRTRARAPEIARYQSTVAIITRAPCRRGRRRSRRRARGRAHVA